MATEELGIIIRVKPYSGNDSWLDCGGEHLTEEGNEEANFASTLENKIMYAIIHVSQDLKTWSDWGYKSRKEAEATLKATAPKSKLIYVE
ncbi:MAG: hypothetical protein M1368_04630 [Thaumarchaeota archaeon]|jgi:hypothetical protein|nr:hypothetical protein [Nitrososphaerota archaeon]